MAEALKEMFNQKFYEQLAAKFLEADKKFNKHGFVKDVTADIENLSLNERLRNTSIVLKKHLPADYKKSLSIMQEVIPLLNKGYTTLVFPDYVGLYGKQDFESSLNALKYFTQFGSSEFAIREFLKNDFYKTIRVMEKWAEDENHHVRRLASEGSRARLPWSFKLDEVIKKPESTKKILETLKSDTELYVKKSVANHLNDISKDNPAYMLKTVAAWNKDNLHTAWIIKHASRTLIKKGNAESMAIFNFEKNPKVELLHFKIHIPVVRLGDSLTFSFDLVSKKTKKQKLVIDYIIHYKKMNNVYTKKVFKLKEIELGANQKLNISKSQVFKDFSTRKHYSGKHKLELMINGRVCATKEFMLQT
jgi:3-methyladenine DNA glycosylase AlkC